MGRQTESQGRMTVFQVGDRVVVINATAGRWQQVGCITATDRRDGPTLAFCNAVDFGDGRRPGLYRADELERKDDQMDQPKGSAAAGGEGVPGPATDNALDRDAAEHTAGEGTPHVAPVAMAPAEALSPVQEFLTQVGMGERCWLWKGAIHNSEMGYGHIGGKLAHRISFALFRGPIPAGIGVLHHCDVPLCVNPAHLFLGTQQDNMTDAREKRRVAWGERHHNARLTESEVILIRQRYAHGGVTQQALADEFGVQKRQVSRIIRRERWANV